MKTLFPVHRRLYPRYDKKSVMTSIREQNKITKRKSIIEAAIRLFSDKGYEQTSIEELAREAGVGKGTVYSYFETKKDIVRAFCEVQLEYTRNELTAGTNPETTLKEQLLVIFMAEFRHVTANKEFGRLFLQEKSSARRRKQCKQCLICHSHSTQYASHGCISPRS